MTNGYISLDLGLAKITSTEATVTSASKANEIKRAYDSNKPVVISGLSYNDGVADKVVNANFVSIAKTSTTYEIVLAVGTVAVVKITLTTATNVIATQYVAETLE